MVSYVSSLSKGVSSILIPALLAGSLTGDFARAQSPEVQKVSTERVESSRASLATSFKSQSDRIFISSDIVLDSRSNSINSFFMPSVSRFIASLNKEFQTTAAGDPILILDPDMLNLQRMFWRQNYKGDWSAELAEAFFSKNDSKNPNLKFLSEYVHDKTGVILSEYALSGINHGLSLGHPFAAMPTKENKEALDSSSSKGACVVVLPSMYNSIQDDLHFFLGTSIWDKEPEHKITVDVSKAEFFLFAAYHELAQCKDGRYYTQMLAMGDANEDYGTEAHKKYLDLRHRVEMLGDTFAALKLASLGHKNAAGNFADLRVVRSKETGKKLSYFEASVYYTRPALTAAQAMINQRGVDYFKGLNNDELMALAYEITEKSALSTDKLINLGQYLKNPESYLAMWREGGTPKDKEIVFKFVENYEAILDSARSRVFKGNIIAPKKDNESLGEDTVNINVVRKTILSRIAENSACSEHFLWSTILQSNQFKNEMAEKALMGKALTTNDKWFKYLSEDLIDRMHSFIPSGMAQKSCLMNVASVGLQ